MELSIESLKRNPEGVKSNFDLSVFLEGQKRAWDLLYHLKEQIKPGMSEAEAHEIYSKLQQESGAEKHWHPAKIRFGANTLKSFREISDDTSRLLENDIFFLDFGPIYDGYEGDVGRTFTLGQHSAGEKVIAKGEEIYQQVAHKFKSEKLSGPELYAYAEKLAEEAGYELVGEGAKGHRVGDFPHAIHHRGSLKDFAHVPSPNRWILEIQLRDRQNQVGAFYEDVLG